MAVPCKARFKCSCCQQWVACCGNGEQLHEHWHVCPALQAVADPNPPRFFTRPLVPPTGQTPLDVQVGGGHYKDFPIQPVEFITKNKLGYIEGAVIKYVCRHGQKNGREDIEKAIHYLQLLLELNYPKT